MEEASEPLSLVIEGWSIAKVAAGGLLSFFAAYLVKPFLFILRDKAIWAYIRRYILNQDASKLAIQLASSDATLRHHYVYESELHFHKTPNEFYIGNTRASLAEAKKYDDLKKSCRDFYNARWMDLHSLSNRLERITKHFGQHSGDAIEKLVEAEKEYFNSESKRPRPYKPRGLEEESS